MNQLGRYIEFALAIGALCLFASHAEAQSCDAPNPNMTIAKPGPAVAPNAALFSGVWGAILTSEVGRGHNKQNASRCYKLYVSVVDSSSAAVAYCYGTSSYTGSGPQCDKYTATIAGSVLAFKANLGGNVSFTSRSTNMLAVEIHSDAGLRSIQGDFQREQ